jgi:phenylpropionate dioxygenase-like ring-hydroxylating dioxygenase large terminal subunit
MRTSERALGFDQNWYAICLSSEIDDGRVLGVDVLGGRVAVYRAGGGAGPGAGAGEPVVLSSRCPHMGADLSQGTVVGERLDELQCLFHHFCFGSDGRCTSIPSRGRIPKAAKVFSFPVRERWGLVWIFNGPEPLFDVPGIRDHDDAVLAVRAKRTDVFPVEPWVILGNSFDFAHLRYVHGLEFEFDPRVIRWGDPHHVEYDMEFVSAAMGMKFHQRIRVTGTNTVSYVTTGDVDSSGLFTSTPTPAGSQSFYVFATPDTRGKAKRLELQETLAHELLKDDTSAFVGMRFQVGAFIPVDRELRRWFDRCDRFPKHDTAAVFGSA